MGAVLEFSARLESCVCGECGIEWAMPAGYLSARRVDGVRFHCPNGHVRVFRETELDKLKAEIEREKRRADLEKIRRESAERQVEAASRSRDAYKGQVTAIKNRVGNGVCPCCSRSFTNLRRHMATKHPAFKGEGAGDGS